VLRRHHSRNVWGRRPVRRSTVSVGAPTVSARMSDANSTTAAASAGGAPFGNLAATTSSGVDTVRTGSETPSTSLRVSAWSAAVSGLGPVSVYVSPS
jgi:hypothetical protein